VWTAIAVWCSRKRDKLGVPRTIDAADRVIGAAKTGMMQASTPLAMFYVSPEMVAIAGRWRFTPFAPVAFLRQDVARVHIVQGMTGARVTIMLNGNKETRARFMGNGPQVAQLLHRHGWGPITAF